MPKEFKVVDIQFISITRREYFTFLICIVLSLSLIFLNDNPQINNLRAAVVDSWAHTLQIISKYRSMAEMRNELTRLRHRTSDLLLENSQLRKAALENHRLRTMLKFKEASPYSLVVATVIARDQDPAVRSVIVDVGEREGVQKGDAVILPMGIVGKILHTGESTSLVQLYTDYNFRVACKIQRSRVNGILQQQDSKTSIVTQVPKNADVRIGDLVVTSGYSYVFPAEIQAAKVVEIKTDSPSLFKKIVVEPFVDVTRIEDVFVIKRDSVATLPNKALN
ncbi:MAG: rod shape-determining protein MreC [Deferribacteres bacterium]|nr:rod shape-determining protein MreC [candidate division KSB1 bacterium]MCB9503337.1 rod shape-determining protein MreC [Deferribacteres bacterium]